ncbi:MAG: type II toxin-antitoxin system VapC family toxin [Anaerolineae bacterium]
MAAPRYLLDTGVLIRQMRGRKSVLRLVRGITRLGRVAISPVTHLELYAGLRPREDYAARKLLRRFQTVPMDANTRRQAGELIRQQRAKGRILSIPDAIIAATTLQHGLTLVTFNPGDFDLPGLQLHPLDVLP